MSYPTPHPLTDTGRQRDHNEDAFWVPGASWPPPAQMAALGALYVVADGMGGHQAGEVASALAVQLIPRVYYGDADPDRAAALKRAIQAANREIHRQAQTDPRRAKMGATLVAAVRRDSELIVAHAGDSRAYLLHRGRLHRLTTDHTWVAERQQAGILTPDEAAHHPMRSVVTRSLGEKPEVEPEVRPFAFQPGDTLLLCTDGLWEPVGDAALRQILSQHPPRQAVHRLVQAANAAGGPDNVTAIVVGPDARGRLSRKGLPALALLVALGGVILLIVAVTGMLLAIRACQPGKAPVVVVSPAPGPASTLAPSSTPSPTPSPTPLPPTPTPTIAFDTSLGMPLTALSAQSVTLTLPPQPVTLTIPAQTVTITTDGPVTSRPLEALPITLDPGQQTVTPTLWLTLALGLQPRPLALALDGQPVTATVRSQPVTVTFELPSVTLSTEVATTPIPFRPTPVGVMITGKPVRADDKLGIRVSADITYTLVLAELSSPPAFDFDWMRTYALIENGKLLPLWVYGTNGQPKAREEWEPITELEYIPKSPGGQAWFYLRGDEDVNDAFWEELRLTDFQPCPRVLLQLAWQRGSGWFTPTVKLGPFCCDEQNRCRHLPK